MAIEECGDSTTLSNFATQFRTYISHKVFMEKLYSRQYISYKSFHKNPDQNIGKISIWIIWVSSIDIWFM